jgi:hypothetical protein
MFNGAPCFSQNYFRFSPSNGLYDIPFDQSKRLPEIEELAHSYIKGQEDQLQQCAARVQVYITSSATRALSRYDQDP